MNTAAVGLGSNMEPEMHIKKALDIIACDQCLVSTSPLVRTTPLGPIEQADFLNGACLVKTTLGKDDFIRYLKDVEDQLGRDRTAHKWGPRIIDLDLVFWNGTIVDDDYYSREFLRTAIDQLVHQHQSHQDTSDETPVRKI